MVRRDEAGCIARAWRTLPITAAWRSCGAWSGGCNWRRARTRARSSSSFAQSPGHSEVPVSCRAPRWRTTIWRRIRMTTPAGRPEAIHDLHRALALRPNYPEALNSLGFALAQSGRPAEGLVFNEKPLQLKPTLAEAHNNRGIALTGVGVARRRWRPFVEPPHSIRRFRTSTRTSASCCSLSAVRPRRKRTSARRDDSGTAALHAKPSPPRLR